MEKKLEFSGLHNLVAPKGARKAPKRLGRGESSGHGKTSGRGNKGQKARKSGNVRIGFEGGQNPFYRRTPKHGFTSFYTKPTVINLRDLFERFEDNSKIDLQNLVAKGLLSNMKEKVKILGVGDPRKAFSLHVHAISGSAKDKIEKAGGTVEILK